MALVAIRPEFAIGGAGAHSRTFAAVQLREAE